jgi:phage tail sheath protein FI
MEAGVSSFEFDSDIGFKIKSGVVTQIANSSKLTVLRRRMTDFLTNSIAKFLKLYQNDVNSLVKRTAVKAAILNFVRGQESLGILPKDSEVNGGNAKIVDIEVLNTDASLAAGNFFIQYKQRIFSSMRFIILRAEIGESVVVTEGE